MPLLLELHTGMPTMDSVAWKMHAAMLLPAIYLNDQHYLQSAQPPAAQSCLHARRARAGSQPGQLATCLRNLPKCAQALEYLERLWFATDENLLQSKMPFIFVEHGAKRLQTIHSA
jgi:hypothetical protein